MTAEAWLFPGQGSHRVGMGERFDRETDVGRELFDRAESVLSIPLRRLCFEGPEGELTRTENQQPALFVVSCIAAGLLRGRRQPPQVCAGHSLGEYSALAAAGALTFEDGLRLVRRRGELMAAVGDAIPGAMAAVLNLPADTVREICAESAATGVVEVANLNSPEQTVISGERAAVARASELARARGARRVVPLNVAAPFHCSLMRPMAEEFGAYLATAPIRVPTIPVIANVTAEVVRSPEEIRSALIAQIAGSVRWTETIRRMVNDGVTRFVEVGSGRVLTGLVRRIAPECEVLDTEEALA